MTIHNTAPYYIYIINYNVINIFHNKFTTFVIWSGLILICLFLTSYLTNYGYDFPEVNVTSRDMLLTSFGETLTGDR